MAKGPQDGGADVPFPIKGIDLSQAISSQPSLTTPDAENVRAYDPVSDRNRGAQRSGLIKYCPDQLAAKSVQEIVQAIATPAPGQGYIAGGGDIYIPYSSGSSYDVYNNDGTKKYSKPWSPQPGPAAWDQDGQLFFAVPNNNGFAVQLVGPNGQAPAGGGWGNPGGAAGAVAQVKALGGQNGVAPIELRVDDVDLNAGDMLFAAVAEQGPVAGPTFTCAFAGQNLPNGPGDAAGFASDGDFSLYSFHFKAAGAIRGDVVATPTGVAGHGPAQLLVWKITGLVNGARDGVGASGTNTSTTPSSGAALATANANDVIMGILATKGPITDVAPTWTAPLQTLTRDGTNTGVAAVNATLAVAFRNVNVVGAYTAAATGITSRNWFMQELAYK